MSVPGRIGIILIIALALVDALILASGAKHAATAIETHALAEQTAMQPEAVKQEIDPHATLIAAALHRINLMMSVKTDKLTGI